MQSYSSSDLRTFQLQDSDISPLIEWTESQYEPSDAELRLESRNSCSLVNWFLFRDHRWRHLLPLGDPAGTKALFDSST